MLEPIGDLIAGLKYHMAEANPGPFRTTPSYGAIISESFVPGDYPPDEYYEGKTLIGETIQGVNGPLIVALLNNAPGIIDALETLIEALESAGVHPDLVDATARAHRKNGMKQKIEAARRESQI
jgi:hypothetical protein